MDYKKFYFCNENYLILATTKTFSRTQSGKSWKSKPDKIEKKIFEAKNYENYITSIPFFNNFGSGAYCRGYNSYTTAGYLPTKVVTVSPFREIKKITTFIFIKKVCLRIRA